MITSAPWPAEEGIGNYVLRLSRELIKMNHEVQILTRGGISKATSEQWEGIGVHKIPFFPLYPFHADFHAPFLRSELKMIKPEPDIIHYHSPLVPFIDMGIPSVVTVHTPMAFDVEMIEVVDFMSLAAKMTLNISSLRIEKKLFIKSNAIATVSAQVSDELDQLGYAKQKIHSIGVGVDVSRYLPGKTPRDDNSVLFVGRLSYRKGLWDLIAAAKQVLKEDRNVVFNVVGDGPLYDKMKERIRNEGIEENVKLLGRIGEEELISFFQTCGLFVLPSHYEGLPAVLLEAMSTGAPIVSTNIGGTKELIENGKNGLIVPTKNPILLANSIIDLLRDRKRALEIGLKGRATILERYTWEMVAKRYEDLYSRVLDERERNRSVGN